MPMEYHTLWRETVSHVNMNMFTLMNYWNKVSLFYPRFNEVERGVYWFHLVRLSVCPSVCLWTESCPLCIFNNTRRIHWNFGKFFKFL